MATVTRKRVDRNRLGKLERTPQGGVFVHGDVMRVGILEYWNADGTICREYNPPDVVAAATPLLAGIPLTNEHPPESVGPGNFRKYASGYAVGEPKFDGTKAGVRFALQESELITDVDTDVRNEISLGYSASVDYTPGTTPEGQKYDGIRTEIVPNHAAVVVAGRAGPDVRLRLDSNGDCLTSQVGELQDKPPGCIFVDTMTAEQIAKLQADLLAATVRADTAEADLKAASAALKAAKEKLDTLDKARVDALKAKAKALRPKLAEKIDSADEAYAAAVVDAAEAEEAKEEEKEEEELPFKKKDSTSEIAAPSATPKLDARERMIRRNRGEKV